MIKCKGKDYNGNTCRNNIKDDTYFCKYHYYMKDYTEDMLNNLTYCSCCKKYYYIVEGKLCSQCKERGKKNCEKKNKEKIICEKDGCTFQRSIENEFCGKHQIEYFKKEVIKSKKKVCFNYIRGCRNILEINYEKSKCIECLKKDRLHDKKKRDNVNFEIKKCEIVVNINNSDNKEIDTTTKDNTANDNDITTYDDVATNNDNIIIDDDSITTDDDSITTNDDSITTDDDTTTNNEKDNIKIRNLRKNKYIDDKLLEEINNGNYEIKCKRCKKFSDKRNFIDKNGIITKKCIECREKAKIIDSKRIITEEIIKKNKENAKKPERLETKREWKEENYDKTAKYWLDYRTKKIQNENDKYWENNATCMKAWRDKNPEKTKQINEDKKININYSFKNYIRSANSKNLLFELTKEEFIEICSKECFYCGDIQDKGFNGIDRIDCKGNYVKDNIVPCCEICNWMKNTLNQEVFLKRIEHIMIKNKFIKGELKKEYFYDYKTSKNYKSYKISATKRNIKIDIDKKTFLYLIHHNCYLCGKKTDDEHQNGIDRVDNDKGYILENVQPCCGNCNFIKNKFSLKIIFEKFKKIMIKKEFNVKNIEFTPNIISQERIDKFFQKNEDNFVCDDEKEYDTNNTDFIEETIKKNVENLEINNKEKERIRKQKYREKKIDNDGIKHLNKKTPEEKREAERLKKQIQRQKLREKYGDEEYKKIRANEIAEIRKKNDK
jgi:hypothetical protein